MKTILFVLLLRCHQQCRDRSHWLWYNSSYNCF